MGQVSKISPFNQRLQLPASARRLWLQADQELDIPGGTPKRIHTKHNLLLRGIDHFNLVPDTPVVPDVATTLGIVATHFSKLQKCGAKIVSHTHEARDDLRPAKERRVDTLVAHGASILVKNSVGLDPDMVSGPSQERINDTIKQPLIRYLSWVVNTKQPYILADIYDLDQYSWHTPSDTIFLHDIDPFIHQTSEEGWERAMQLTLQLPIQAV